MVDVSINSLISMAQDYVERRGVDKDQSGTINDNKELNLLLAGTGASSIEDLTASDIREKIVERDTEKVFTTFMATDNQEQAKINMDLLGYSIETISETYDKLLKGFDTIVKLISESEMQLKELKYIFKEGDFGQEAVDRVVKKLERFHVTILTTIKELDNINAEYNETTGQDFMPIQQNKKILIAAEEQLLEQISKIKNSSVPIEQAKNEIEEGIIQISTALIDAYKLRAQYENQKENDEQFLTMLYEYQHRFLKEGKYSNEERQAYSKDFLCELVDKTSPMTRNFIIQQAERVYNPENDPTTTGISQNNAKSNIKRSSYKTPTEIYTLRGNNVFVSDYSGKVLRTETLDPSVHTKFFE